MFSFYVALVEIDAHLSFPTLPGEFFDFFLQLSRDSELHGRNSLCKFSRIVPKVGGPSPAKDTGRQVGDVADVAGKQCRAFEPVDAPWTPISIAHEEERDG